MSDKIEVSSTTLSRIARHVSVFHILVQTTNEQAGLEKVSVLLILAFIQFEDRDYMSHKWFLNYIQVNIDNQVCDRNLRRLVIDVGLN